MPRSLSTAFERVFVERDDFAGLHEPFSAAYYYGPDRLSDRFGELPPRPERRGGYVRPPMEEQTFIPERY